MIDPDEHDNPDDPDDPVAAAVAAVFLLSERISGVSPVINTMKAQSYEWDRIGLDGISEC